MYYQFMASNAAPGKMLLVFYAGANRQHWTVCHYNYQGSTYTVKQLNGKNQTTSRWNRILTPFALGALIVLSACQIPSGGFTLSNIGSVLTGGPEITATDQAMVSDLADVVAQIFDPLDTTLQINRGNQDPIMSSFVSLLTEYGFGIQRVSADQGANYLSYARKESEEDGAEDILFSVDIGAVTVARDYRLVGQDRVTPVSTLRISGSRVPVNANDETGEHFLVSNPEYSEARYVASLGLDAQAPVISLITPELVNQVTNRSTNNAPSLYGMNSSMVEVANLFYGVDSTFASMLDNRERVERQVIVFGNDSLILGETNKLLINQLVENQLQQNDLISLVGCSNGHTALDIGNEGLALGRAKRVTEELLSIGIARDRILDEGCWAPTSVRDRFPSRGVVLELWRKNA